MTAQEMDELREHTKAAARIAEAIDWSQAPHGVVAYEIGRHIGYWIEGDGTRHSALLFGVEPNSKETRDMPQIFRKFQQPHNTHRETSKPRLGGYGAFAGIPDRGSIEHAEQLSGKRPGENPHSGDINGYRKMSDAEAELINTVKQAERDTAALWARVADREGTDGRWAGIAKTHLEQGFMALVRSIAKPKGPFEAN